MIKFLALILMVIDHIGHMLKSGVIYQKGAFVLSEVLSLLGRFSMPLFAYCIARGFDHYKKTGNMKKYFKNIAIMAILAQIPFTILKYKMSVYYNTLANSPEKISIFSKFVLNIGFTWLVALGLLLILKQLDFSNEQGFINKLTQKNILFICLAIAICVAICLVAPVCRIEYGLYAVLCVIVFYYFCFKFNSPILLLLSSGVLYLIYCAEHSIGLVNNTGQVFATFSICSVSFLQKYDKTIKLPKFIFYWFYPLHLAILALLYFTVFINPKPVVG